MTIGALFILILPVFALIAVGVDATTLEGAKQTIALGPVASQEAIKMLGTNGGGFFNANSAHPFENPTALTNLIQLLAIFTLGAGLTGMFGRMVGDKRQGWAVFAAMFVLFAIGVAIAYGAEAGGNPLALLELPHALTDAEWSGYGRHGTPLTSRIEREFLSRLESLDREVRRFLLVAAAEPLGDTALLWRAVDQLGLDRRDDHGHHLLRAGRRDRHGGRAAPNGGKLSRERTQGDSSRSRHVRQRSTVLR